MADELLVLYDRDCGFCAWALAWLLRWDYGRRLRPVAIQSEQGQRCLAALEPQARLASWHAVDRRGAVLSGSAALPSLLERLPAGAPLARLAAAVPALSARSYGWIAAHRTLLSRPIPARSKRRARELIARRML